ncbi:MAG: ATP-binding protein [Alphaproteobacteria bacterium]
MTEAMRQIRDALGEEAIIVSTRDGPGGSVRVTAAVEQQNPSFEDVLQHVDDDGYSGEEIIELVTDTLLKHRVPGTVSEKIIAAAIIQNTNDPQKALQHALERTFSFLTPAQRPRNPLMLVGPPGAGKTLMAAKLAARAVMEGHKPTVITTDITRAGGIEQLSAFLDILELPLGQARDARSLKAAVDDAENLSQTIIDTGGLNPFDPQEMKTLSRLIVGAQTDAALVLPAGIDAEESAEIAMTFEVLGIRRLIPTRLDFARRIGGILSAADRGGLSFADASHTPQVANGILSLDSAALAGLLMPHVPKKAQVKPKPKTKKGRA